MQKSEYVERHKAVNTSEQFQRILGLQYLHSDITEYAVSSTDMTYSGMRRISIHL